MAEISQNNSEKHIGGKVRAKKMSVRVDMTPMVDLAFLLLCFFIFTTTFHKPFAIPLTMPEPTTDPRNVPMLKAENAFSLVLGEADKLYWWVGFDPSAKLTNYSSEGLRKVLIETQLGNPDVMVLIKPMDNARYENMVNVLDEIQIANITRYAIIKFTEEDKGVISR